MEIDTKYEKLCATYSDISEHLPTLYKYGLDCTSIIEAGVRYGVSTYAFLKSIKDKSDGKLISLDLGKTPQIDEIETICKRMGIDYKFVKGNDLDYDIT